ncbi:MAG TPA: c-type cytochrome [Vicinamibacterales bacterium]|nr:c-type cytochrome [Vicinamibacterales bacterium]
MVNVHRPLLALSSAVFLVAAGNAFVSAQAPKTPTVWDGVYTDAQAERATATFSSSCARCHTLAADGSGNRPLTGDKFWEGYTQKTVGDLLKFVSTNMPNGAAAGSLSASAYNDLVALILKSNGFPPGTTELAPETVANVQIIPKGGPGELPANTLVRMVGCLGPKAGSDWTLTNATDPVRIDKTGSVPEDATRPLGTRTIALKFVLTKLDTFAGQRMSVTGILLGAGGANGLNVSTVNRVAEACP